MALPRGLPSVCGFGGKGEIFGNINKVVVVAAVVVCFAHSEKPLPTHPNHFNINDLVE